MCFYGVALLNRFFVSSLLIFGGLAISVCANAALIRITPTGVAVDEQVDTGPVPIGADGFRLSYWSNGNHDVIINPLVLIVATPTGTGDPTVMDATNLNPDNQNPTDMTAAVADGVQLGT